MAYDTIEVIKMRVEPFIGITKVYDIDLTAGNTTCTIPDYWQDVFWYSIVQITAGAGAVLTHAKNGQPAVAGCTAGEIIKVAITGVLKTG